MQTFYFLIKQKRWEEYFFEKSNEIDDTIAVSNFGFKSALTPL